MRRKFLMMLVLIAPIALSAQRTDREYVRKGNKLYSDSLYIKAEENYLKAIDKNSSNINAGYNLGNAYLYQQKAKEAMEQYQETATALELERRRLSDSNASEKELNDFKQKAAMTYHNMGTVLQAAQNYAQAIAAYQEALRNNPNDHETRYNLALAMHQLKQQQQNQQNQQQQNQERQQEQQKEDQQNQQQNQDQQQEQQEQQNQQEQQESDMSKENAEQLLQAAMQDEKDVQERVKQAIQVQPKGTFDKDW
ncbi:MAG: tetratricopeptide repeat protein [Bacteroidaceae bacterium]|nr:tetratricopeptide repeat protein [Bacteroidaceae bacterium]